jgi:hypothetical protein
VGDDDGPRRKKERGELGDNDPRWGGGGLAEGLCALKPGLGAEGMSPRVYRVAGEHRDASGTDEDSWRRVSIIKYVD